MCQELRRPEPRLTAEVLAALQRREWAGNIRELKNVIERAVLLCAGSEIKMEHLPEERPRKFASGQESGAGGPGAGPQDVRRDAPDRTDSVGLGQGQGKGKGKGNDGRYAGSHPTAPHPRSETPDPAGAVSLDKQRILDALASCAGNQSRAAKLLGMPRRTFVARLDRYQIARPKKDPLKSQQPEDIEEP